MAMWSAAFGQNPFQDFLEGSEQGARINYQGRIPQSFGSQQQDYVGSLFQPTFSRYLGALGRQIGQGQAPTLSFTDYLNENFNPQRELLRAPAGSAGPQMTRQVRPYFDRL